MNQKKVAIICVTVGVVMALSTFASAVLFHRYTKRMFEAEYVVDSAFSEEIVSNTYPDLITNEKYDRLYDAEDRAMIEKMSENPQDEYYTKTGVKGIADFGWNKIGFVVRTRVIKDDEGVIYTSKDKIVLFTCVNGEWKITEAYVKN
ncbi:MAG: hypothetical protein IJC85_05925 [Oscillospiraceae bacterium]|nr:hypothetical protein [Oscillospiraceae bacterium]